MGELQFFFDLECTQSESFSHDTNKFEHIPNLCISHQSCDACYDENCVDIPCANCGEREKVFLKTNIIHKFMEYYNYLKSAK